MAKVTAFFSERDSASLTLLRLRRSGVDFDLIALKSRPESAEPVLPGGFAATANSLAQPEGRSEASTELELSVRQSQLQRAWDIMRSTGAKEIRSRG